MDHTILYSEIFYIPVTTKMTVRSYLIMKLNNSYKTFIVYENLMNQNLFS